MKFFSFFTLFFAVFSLKTATANDYSRMMSLAPLENLLLEIDLAKQVCNVISRNSDDSEKLIGTIQCTTGPGKYGEHYPKGSSPAARTCLIIASGAESEDGLRTSKEAGGVEMGHYLELGIYYPDGKTSRAIGIHAGSGEFVSRIPATMGCIRLPTSAAKALYIKVRGNAKKGGVGRNVPVRFVGETPSLW